MIEWKSVEKDGLPEKSGLYLTCNNKRAIYAWDYSSKYRLWNCGDLCTVEQAKFFAVHGITHWAEINLPDAPLDALKHARITAMKYARMCINLLKD